MSALLMSTSSSDEEETTARPPSKVCKKCNKQYYMHLASVKKEGMEDFTKTRSSVQQWLDLHGESQRVAETYTV